MKKLIIGRTYAILTEDWRTWTKEGHELDGHVKVVGLSKGNGFTVLAKRPRRWYEAQVALAERYAPARGGTIRWRGQILVSADYLDKHFKLLPKAEKAGSGS